LYVYLSGAAAEEPQQQSRSKEPQQRATAKSHTTTLSLIAQHDPAAQGKPASPMLQQKCDAVA
jgi:hypothetical protein